MPLTLPKPVYKGITFCNELEAKWAVAFDELNIEYEYCPIHAQTENILHVTNGNCYTPFWLPQVQMYAQVFAWRPKTHQLQAARKEAEFTGKEILLLIDEPGPYSYFALGGKWGFEIAFDGKIYTGCDYLIFNSTTTTEQRFYANTGEDVSCFPMPIQSETFEDDCENLAILKAKSYSAYKPAIFKPVDFDQVGIPAGATDFGTWFIEGDELVLKREDWRRIDFELCNSSARILDWIFHYQGRITSEELGDMIEALQAILHPMANYCSNGIDKKADGLSLLRKWLAPQSKRKPIKPSLRFEILKRDDYRCQMCGVTAKDGATLEIDHIHPVSRGGTNEPDNLQVLCRDCNAGKGAQCQ
jgi:hypothetical protein